jgi:CBS domain-containing protein
MPVKDAMNRDVISADPKTNVREIARIMVDNRIGSVIIMKNGKMVGIITERDLLSFFSRGEDADKTIVESIMTRYVISIGPEATLEKASDVMVENKIKKLPVIQNEKLVGIITASDLAVAAPAKIKKLKKIISRSGA